jgi:hypothetical protein
MMSRSLSRLTDSQALLPLGALCLGIAIIARGPLEKAMLTHMLVQLPLLFVAGWAMRAGWQKAPRQANRWQHWARYDQYGLSGLLAAMLIGAYWMVPRALELSLRLPLEESAKIASLFLMGWILPASWSRANIVVQLFFIGNFCWMTAIAGMLYQDSPQRLCNAYLLDDQIDTGIGLVVLAVLIAAVWAIKLMRKQQAQDAAAVPAAIE